jgi:hypothetical protein
MNVRVMAFAYVLVHVRVFCRHLLWLNSAGLGRHPSHGTNRDRLACAFVLVGAVRRVHHHDSLVPWVVVGGVEHDGAPRHRPLYG